MERCERTGASVVAVSDLGRRRDYHGGVPSDARLERARRALVWVYFLFGLAIMSWIPRFPDIKDGLGVSAAQFGLLVSLGAAGSITASTFMGHVTHHFGSRTVLSAGAASTYLTLATITLSPNPWVFALMVVLLSASVSGYNVGLNAQSVLLQAKFARPIIGRFHGAWSLGAFVTGILASFIAPRLSPQAHVAGIALVLLPIVLIITRSLLGPEHDDHMRNPDEPRERIPSLRRTPRAAWLLALGLTGGTFAEFVNGDWSTIYARDYLNVPAGPDVYLFSAMMVSVMVGRMLSDRVIAHFGVTRVVRTGAVFIMVGMTSGALGSYALASRSPYLALAVACLGFALAGLGTAPMVPAFFGAAGHVDGLPVGVTLARVGLAQQVFVWLLKALVAFLTGVTGLTLALLVPALTALAAFALARHADRSAIDRRPPMSSVPADASMDARG